MGCLLHFHHKPLFPHCKRPPQTTPLIRYLHHRASDLPPTPFYDRSTPTIFSFATASQGLDPNPKPNESGQYDYPPDSYRERCAVRCEKAKSPLPGLRQTSTRPDCDHCAPLQSPILRPAESPTRSEERRV